MGQALLWHDAFTVGDVLVRGAERHPQSLAVVVGDDGRTYRELLDGAMRAARSLSGLGVRRGQHVGILMPNCHDFLDVLFGASLLGAVIVPINARFKAREIAHVVGNGDVDVLVTSDMIDTHADYVALLHEALDGLAGASDPFALDLPAAPRLRSVVLLGRRTTPGMLDDATFRGLAAGVSEESVDRQRSTVAMRDVAIMMFTSGTTAMPKGCPMSQEGLVRTAVVAGRTRFDLTAEDRFWDPLPMFHMSAILPLLATLDAGAAFLSLLHFTPEVGLAQMRDHGATASWSSFPAVAQALLNHPDYHADTWANLRFINNVAPPDTLREMQARMPHTVQVSSYGCTETGGCVSTNELSDTLEQRTTTCGRPYDGIELEIRDLETDATVAPGERGEILVRGYSVFEGYYKDPELTRERFTDDGWFRTGDIGTWDPEGRVVYLGRTKDMLKVGGENVAALEIESVLATHPAVSIAAVVGVPDPKYMEVPAAFVELRPGFDTAADELLDHCRASLARFKVPHHVRVVAEWPMSATKIQKYKLAEQLTLELRRDRAVAGG
jgi:fatty-acyl-CoA synthase